MLSIEQLIHTGKPIGMIPDTFTVVVAEKFYHSVKFVASMCFPPKLSAFFIRHIPKPGTLVARPATHE